MRLFNGSPSIWSIWPVGWTPCTYSHASRAAQYLFPSKPIRRYPSTINPAGAPGQTLRERPMRHRKSPVSGSYSMASRKRSAVSTFIFETPIKKGGLRRSRPTGNFKTRTVWLGICRFKRVTNKKAEPEGCGKLVGSTREETSENLVPHRGIEPRAFGLQIRRSTY